MLAGGGLSPTSFSFWFANLSRRSNCDHSSTAPQCSNVCGHHVDRKSQKRDLEPNSDRSLVRHCVKQAHQQDEAGPDQRSRTEPQPQVLNPLTRIGDRDAMQLWRVGEPPTNDRPANDSNLIDRETASANQTVLVGALRTTEHEPCNEESNPEGRDQERDRHDEMLARFIRGSARQAFEICWLAFVDVTFVATMPLSTAISAVSPVRSTRVGGCE